MRTCEETCGNGVIEQCAAKHPQGDACPTYVDGLEPCDGASVASCLELGYFGGSTTCSSTCQVGGDTCDPCGPGLTQCQRLPFGGVFLSHPAMAGATRFVLAAGTSIKIFELQGASFVQTAAQTLGSSPLGLVAVPDGWLIADPMRVYHLDAAGVIAPAAMFSSYNSQFAVMAATSNRVLIVFTESTGSGPYLVRGMILDTTGASVGSAFTLFTGDSTMYRAPAVTSDGTAFFAAMPSGTLARVLPDGSVTSTATDFPRSDFVELVWRCTTGWYLGGQGLLSYTAQAFAADGTKVGSPITTTSSVRVDALDVVNGTLTGLVTSSASPPMIAPLRLVTFDASGAVATATVIAAATIQSPWMRPLGNGFLIDWNTWNAHWLGVVTP